MNKKEILISERSLEQFGSIIMVCTPLFLFIYRIYVYSKSNLIKFIEKIITFTTQNLFH